MYGTQKIIGVVSLISLAVFAVAQVPATIIARSGGSGVGVTPYRVPADVGLTNQQVRINNSGEIAFRTSGAQTGIWFGDAAGGSVKYLTDEIISSSISLNDSGDVVWQEIAFPELGCYRYQKSTNTSGIYFIGPLGNTGWSSPFINNSGQVGFRGTVSGQQVWTSYSPSGTEYATVATGINATPNGISFLFTPAFNNSRQIGGLVRLDNITNKDEIRRYNPDGSFTVIAKTSLVDPLSPYGTISNLMDMNNAGQFAFTARIGASGPTVLMLSDGVTGVELARSGTGGIGTFDFFAPSVNDNGVVTFRATDSANGNRRAIWVAKAGLLQQVIREGQELTTDVGPGSARWDTTFSSPAFSGKPSINNRNEVAFISTVTNPSSPSQRIGTGVFVTPSFFSARIEGNITLLNTAGLGVVEQIGWTLSNGSQTFTGDFIINDATNGAFGFDVPSAASPGAYTLTFDGGTFLAKTLNITLTGSTLSGQSVSLINGDIDQDGEVGPGDFEAVVAQFGGPGDADTDNDGEVGPSDFEIVVANFGLGDN